MRILFVCEYNACRSQIAEGLARAFLPPEHSVVSAGLYPGRVHELTVEVMKEIGIDISGHWSKRLPEVSGESFDLAVVLAEPAADSVRAIGAKKTVVMHVPDPASEPATDQVLKQRLRDCRDGLRVLLSKLQDFLSEVPKDGR
ncbi:MAG TPA: arsenate reductase ArsC [bacterium]|nr:arsenate reductase ArsC [bacterium]